MKYSLTVINIDDSPVTDPQLELTVGPLSGNYEAVSLLDKSTVGSLQSNAKGGFDAYTPLPEIPPYGVIVIQLTLKSKGDPSVCRSPQMQCISDI